jgi:hypothetical protein
MCAFGRYTVLWEGGQCAPGIFSRGPVSCLPSCKSGLSGSGSVAMCGVQTWGFLSGSDSIADVLQGTGSVRQ